ncbi:MAG: ClpX C4-type zinc finger protein [Acidimicrobiia bacterium]
MFLGPNGAGRGCSFCGRDLWEVDHYVSAMGVAICGVCIEQADTAIRAAGPTTPRELFLPPRVFGDAPSGTAADEVAAAFRTVFSVSGDDVRAAAVEGGADSLTVLGDARDRAGVATANSASFHVSRIRFLDPRSATVAFGISLNRGPGPVWEGSAIQAGGRWLVTRSTIDMVAAVAGVRRT